MLAVSAQSGLSRKGISLDLALGTPICTIGLKVDTGAPFLIGDDNWDLDCPMLKATELAPVRGKHTPCRYPSVHGRLGFVVWK